MSHIVGERHHDPELLQQVDKYLPLKIRARIEEYYAKVSAQAELDVVARNEEFLASPLAHVALYSDHGIVHARDVATNIVRVLDAIHGVLIPTRSAARFDFMKGYGVMLAYNHDIGMMNFSAVGRAMHPEFAAQEVFGATFDEIVETLWDENSSNVAWRLLTLVNHGAFTQEPKLVLREMLALSIGHSKSKVPIQMLNDPAQFRRVLLESVGTDLGFLHLEQQLVKADKKLKQAQKKNAAAELPQLKDAVADARAKRDTFRAEGRSEQNENARRFYADFERDAFLWLVSAHPDVKQLSADIGDTLRALRAADALRQRGTTLRTSAGYQILVDQETAGAVFVLEKRTGEVFLLGAGDKLSSGEANIASSELTPRGDLRISFQRGAFADHEATRRGAENVAAVIDDMQRDIVETFQRPSNDLASKSSDQIEILIEGTDDNLEFADLVLQELGRLDDALGKRSRIVPSLKNVAPEERNRYDQAEDLNWSSERKQRALLRMAQAGHPAQRVDIARAFTDVKVARLRAGEILALSGAPPGFVYVAMEHGLVSTPLGGYQSHSLKPWIPQANTRVIRGGIQEATLSAESDVAVLIIPKEIYLKYWHGTYSLEQFSQLLREVYAEERPKGVEQILNILKQVAMIDAELGEQEVQFIVDFANAYGLKYSAAALRQEIEAGGRLDFVAVRQNVLEYLGFNPPPLQVAQLRDLLNALVKTDQNLAEQEQLILDELLGLLTSYLSEDGTSSEFEVLIVPQSDNQDIAIAALLAGRRKVETSGGFAYFGGSFYSRPYAEMIAKRYRALNFFTTIRQAIGTQAETGPTNGGNAP